MEGHSRKIRYKNWRFSDIEKGKITKAVSEFYAFCKKMKIPIEITYNFPQSILEKAKNNKGTMWAPNQEDYKSCGVDVTFCAKP